MSISAGNSGAGQSRHKSVLALLAAHPGESDAKKLIRRLAREKVAYAKKNFWGGPAFCPKILASIFHIRCKEVSHDIDGDGRILPYPDGKLWIEYHKDRPLERQRFTIFHEFAHTLFPDYCKYLPLQHNSVKKLSDPEKEFENLCDIAAAAISEHKRFLARYLNPGFAPAKGVATIAVAVESDQGTMNPEVANALTQRLAVGDVRLLNSFFKPEFVADKFVDSIFSGDTEVFGRLELTNSLNGVLIGRQTVSYSTNSALENTITANLRLEVMVLPVALTRQNQSWNFAANGIGFRLEEARQMAEGRIIEQIAKSTNMVLAPSF